MWLVTASGLYSWKTEITWIPNQILDSTESSRMFPTSVPQIIVIKQKSLQTPPSHPHSSPLFSSDILLREEARVGMREKRGRLNVDKYQKNCSQDIIQAKREAAGCRIIARYTKAHSEIINFKYSLMSNSILPRPFYPAEHQEVGHKPQVTLFLRLKAGRWDKDKPTTAHHIRLVLDTFHQQSLSYNIIISFAIAPEI